MLSSIPIRNAFQKGLQCKTSIYFGMKCFNTFSVSITSPLQPTLSHRSTSFSTYKAWWMVIWHTSGSSVPGCKALKFSSQVKLKNGRKSHRKPSSVLTGDRESFFSSLHSETSFTHTHALISMHAHMHFCLHTVHTDTCMLVCSCTHSGNYKHADIFSPACSKKYSGLLHTYFTL